MSRVAIEGNPSGTGTFTIASPNSSTDRTLTLPDVTGTFNTSGAVNEVPAGSVSAPSLYPTGDTNTGIFFPAADTIGFAEGGVEAMRIDASGNVLVGTTSAAMNDVVGIKLAPAGDGATYPRVGIVTAATTNGQSVNYSLYSTGAAAYRFYVGAGGTIHATSTTITSLSDQRLKENIRDLDDGLEKVMALRPRKFDWKEGKGENISNARGFIAQEIETVFPDMVLEWLDPAPEGERPYKAVNANLIPTLVKAIQELKAELDTVKAELADLKGQA